MLCGNQVLRFIGHPVQGHGSNREICKGFGADDFCLQCLFYDSNGTDEILDNILCGKKRANTGLFSLFEAQMQLLPRTDDYTVVLDSDMQPPCITRTTKVEVVPFEDVTADCAAAEGDGTLAARKKAHRKAFAAACEEIGRNFDESMKCVCEYFDVVYRADGQ